MNIDNSNMAWGESIGFSVPSYPTADFVEPFVKEVNANGGVDGRKLKVEVVMFDGLSEDAKQAACVKLTEDLKVFAAIAVFGFWGDGEVCLATRETPLLTINFPSDDVLRRREKGWVRSTLMSKDRILKNWADWAIESGIATAKKRIGVWSEGDPESTQVTRDVLLPYLKAKGLNVVETFYFGTDYSRRPVESSSAVLKFKSANVDFVWPAGNYITNIFFLRVAEAQDFHPEYTASDFGYLATDPTSQSYEPNQWDRVRAMAVMRSGESAAGKPLTPAEKECLAAYQRFGGKAFKKDADRFMAMATCEHLALWVKAARVAGPNLTRAGFLNVLDSLGNYSERVTISDTLSFRKGKYDAADRFAVIEWRRECTCYWQIEGFRPGRW
ncbi:MAG: ABC transporter substrate-binding protein [Actinomycetota bacterium]